MALPSRGRGAPVAPVLAGCGPHDARRGAASGARPDASARPPGASARARAAAPAARAACAAASPDPRRRASRSARWLATSVSTVCTSTVPCDRLGIAGGGELRREIATHQRAGRVVDDHAPRQRVDRGLVPPLAQPVERRAPRSDPAPVARLQLEHGGTRAADQLGPGARDARPARHQIEHRERRAQRFLQQAAGLRAPRRRGGSSFHSVAQRQARARGARPRGRRRDRSVREIGNCRRGRPTRRSLS